MIQRLAVGEQRRTMSDMAKSDPLKIGFRVEQKDEDAILALLPYIPGYPKPLSRSVVERALIRLGLERLAKDPGAVTTVQPPPPEKIVAWASATPEGKRAKRESDEAAKREERAPGPETLRRMHAAPSAEMPEGHPSGPNATAPIRPRVDLPDPPRKKRPRKPGPFDTGDGTD